jgi:hypothetical protein
MMNTTMTIHEIIQKLRDEGSDLKPPVLVENMPPMRFGCALSAESARLDDVNSIRPDCPVDLKDFWSEVETARLFEDLEYGQAGLEIYGPKQAQKATEDFRRTRGRDSVDGDLIIGQFFGDSDLVLIRCDPTANDFGGILVALPIDPRRDWYTVASSFRLFLDEFVKKNGDKFWEL